jgi:hypothetical protein
MEWVKNLITIAKWALVAAGVAIVGFVVAIFTKNLLGICLAAAWSGCMLATADAHRFYATILEAILHPERGLE